MNRAFKKLILDQMTKLLILNYPVSKLSYNLILVVVDYLTVYRIFILFKKGLDTEQLTHIFYKIVVFSYNMLEGIRLD